VLSQVWENVFEQWIRKEDEENCCGLLQGTIPEFTQMAWDKPWEILVRMPDFWAKICTWKLPNMNQIMVHLLAILFTLWRIIIYSHHGIKYLQDGSAAAVKNSLPHHTLHIWGSLFSHPVWRFHRYSAVASVSPVILPARHQSSHHLAAKLNGSNLHHKQWAALWWIKGSLPVQPFPTWWCVYHCQSVGLQM